MWYELVKTPCRNAAKLSQSFDSFGKGYRLKNSKFRFRGNACLTTTSSADCLASNIAAIQTAL